MDKMFALVPPQEHEQLAEMIASLWHSAYDTLLGGAQVEYMTQKFQSAAAIREQIMHENYIYFYILSGEEKIGYCAVETEEDRLFLSKLYLKKGDRAKGACGRGRHGKASGTESRLSHRQQGQCARHRRIRKVRVYSHGQHRHRYRRRLRHGRLRVRIRSVRQRGVRKSLRALLKKYLINYG